MSLTDKQKAARDGALGSSDAPTVVGVSPYKSPLELFFQLTGQLPRYSDEETRAQKIGSLIEAPIAELAAEEMGLKIRRSPPRVHPKHAFMTANLDYEIISHPKGVGCLEIKNRGAAKPYDELPDDIQLQVAHQLAVTNRDWGIVAVLFGFGQLKTYEVQRDKEIEEYLIELEARFMVRVQKGEPPDQQWTPQTVDLLKRIHPQDSGRTIDLGQEGATRAASFLSIKQSLEEAEREKATHEGWIKSQMADAANATAPGYAISWKTTTSTKRLDLDRLKAEHPEIIQQYMVDAPGYRRFLVKPTKELTCRTT